MDLENIKESTKQSIIQNFMENVKHARRGAQHQRPKSWSKGTKSGSDKRKMREQGKRETRELHESPDWISAAHEAFQGYISPVGGPLKENTSKKSVNEEENLSLRDRSAKLRARSRGDIWGAWIPAPKVNVRTQSSGQTPMKQAEAPKLPQPEMIKTLIDREYISSEEPIKYRVTPAAHKRLQNLGFTKEQLGDSQEKIKIKDPLTTKLSNFLPFLKK